MPDQQRHRGAHPLDAKLFAPSHLPALREAVAHFSWLLERDYASKSALQLVGNRFSLHERQRLAVMRCACSETAQQRRAETRVEIEKISGQTLHLDGYNILTIIESALAGGVVLLGRDEVPRDIASMHGTFRRVEETQPAIELIGEWLHRFGVSKVVWWLDSPVSNSGRLKTTLLETARNHGWEWDANLVFDADTALKKLDKPGFVVTADSVILDAGMPWVNLGREIIERAVPSAWVLDLSSQIRPMS
jgi:hypothetical protein